MAGRKAGNDMTMENLYTEIAGLGCSWEFVAPEDVARIAGGAVYIPAETDLALDACEALAKLPGEVNIVLANPDALHDEYGRPLPDALMKVIAARACPQFGASHLMKDDAARLTAPYNERTEVGYLAWSPERGHYRYPVPYPKLEAMRVRYANGWLVAVISHGPKVTAKLPWLGDSSAITELTGSAAAIDPAADQTFDPFAVRLFKYEPPRGK